MSERICEIEAILLTGPSTYDPYIREAMDHRCAAFIRVRAENGQTGLGETYLGTFWPEVVPEAVEFYKPILLGQTIDNISELWARMYKCSRFFGRVGLMPTIINGIEAALWDLKGKILGLPVHQLLGGCKHEKLLTYATGGPSNHPESKLKEKIQHYLDDGFRAVKLGSGWFKANGEEEHPTFPSQAADLEAGKLALIRQQFGKELLLALDGHMDNHRLQDTWNVGTALAVLRACEPFDLLFFEEPLSYSDPWGYRELRRNTHVPVAGGECLTGAYEWHIFTELDAFDVGQPDAAFTGGLEQCVKIAQALESRGRSVAMHCWGAGPALMQNVHVAFACGNTMIVEGVASPGPLHTEIIGDSLRMENGFLLPPDKPGLGVELPEEIRKRFPLIRGSGQFHGVPGKPFKPSLGVNW